jgi:hypothetical protein
MSKAGHKISAHTTLCDIAEYLAAWHKALKKDPKNVVTEGVRQEPWSG